MNRNPFTFLFVIAGIAAVFYYFGFLNHVSINEIGVAYDSTDGSITVQHPGWHITSPLVLATTISTLPFRVEINNGVHTTRVLNVKLVRFVPEHVKDFISTQGFDYMSGSQNQIFCPYAFSGKTYPFLEIIQ